MTKKFEIFSEQRTRFRERETLFNPIPFQHLVFSASYSPLMNVFVTRQLKVSAAWELGVGNFSKFLWRNHRQYRKYRNFSKLFWRKYRFNLGERVCLVSLAWPISSIIFLNLHWPYISIKGKPPDMIGFIFILPFISASWWTLSFVRGNQLPISPDHWREWIGSVWHQ